jgi:CubicO group peptidase (beta-lactamase class C family)
MGDMENFNRKGERSADGWAVLFIRASLLKGFPRPMKDCFLAMRLVAVLCTGLLNMCFAEDVNSRMEQIIQDYAGRKQFSGAILVAQGGKIVLDKAYGYANLEWDIPNSPTTKFQIASMTKQFTAASVLLLEERGKLHVEDPVKRYMPDAPPAWDRVTIYNLLTHTSGIPNKYDGITSWTQTKTPEQLVASFRNKPLDFQPGETRKYSNSGYYLLGYLIEKISGQSYGDFVRENILKPLGMNDSGYNSNSEVIPRRASGYHLGSIGPENGQYYDMTLRFSAGGLYSTTEDLLRWEQGLFGGKLLSAASLKKMTTPFKYDFACGLMVSDIDGHPAVEHSGGMDGFSSDMIYYTGDKLTVIVLNNFGGEAKSIALKLASAVHGEKVVLPSERREVTVPSSVLASYVGTYHDLLPGLNLVITLENGHLVSQVTGTGDYKEDKHVLIAESETAFFQKEFESEYEFVKNDKGEITSVLCTQSGHKTEAVRK